MNELQFVNKTNEDPFWEDENVRTLSMSAITYTQEAKSQVRQGGIDNGHIKDIADSLIKNGQKVPITVEHVEKDDDGMSVWRIVDGGHRWTAINYLRKLQPKNKRWTVIRAFVVKVGSEYERQQMQLEANEHGHVAKSTTREDASYWLGRLIQTGIDGAPAELEKLRGSQGRNRIDPEQYEQDLREAVSYQFQTMGARTVNAIIRGYMKTLPGKFRTWSSNTANDDFYIWLRKSGTAIEERHSLVKIRETNHVWQTSAGNALKETYKHGNEDLETVAVVWSNKTSGRSFEAIDTERAETIRNINKLNSHNKLGKGKRIIDRLFICPQKQDGVEESGFYEVQKTQNNRFKLFFPKTGWEV